ncbi:MAG: alpha/beta hydrolase [Fulvivirga sp.]|nr:alpha/beta hydrolase [Fulvivirga sp.]
MKKIFTLTFAFIMSWGVFAQKPLKSETIVLKGKTNYYEVYGHGEPLLLLHGYGQSSKYWRSYITDYQDDFKVYLIDLQGFGKSDSFDPDWSIYSVSKTLNDLLVYLELDSVKAIGLSYGGDVLFQLAKINPSMVQSMITIGAIGSWNVKDNPEYIEYFNFSNLENLAWMKDHVTSESQFRAAQDYFTNYAVFLNDKDLQNIRTKIMIVLGDDDAIPLEEVARTRKNLPNSDLWILPNTGHLAHEGKNRSKFISVSKSFLID